MAALTTIATGLLITSLVLAAVSVATTVVAAKSGNKTLKKIGKISGWVSMGTGIAGAGVGIAASMGTAAATQGAAQTGKTVAQQTAVKTGETVASQGTQAVAKGVAPAVTGTVTPGAAAATPISNVTPATTQMTGGGGKFGAGFINKVSQNAATVGAKEAAANATRQAVTDTALGVGQAGFDVAGTAMGPVKQQNYVPDIVDNMGQFKIAEPVNTAAFQPPVEEKSWIAGWMDAAGEKIGKGTDAIGEFANKNPMATYGIIATIGSGMSGLFEADVADEKLKEERRQFNERQRMLNERQAANIQ